MLLIEIDYETPVDLNYYQNNATNSNLKEPKNSQNI